SRGRRARPRAGRIRAPAISASRTGSTTSFITAASRRTSGSTGGGTTPSRPGRNPMRENAQAKGAARPGGGRSAVVVLAKLLPDPLHARPLVLLVDLPRATAEDEREVTDEREAEDDAPPSAEVPEHGHVHDREAELIRSARPDDVVLSEPEVH